MLYFKFCAILGSSKCLTIYFIRIYSIVFCCVGVNTYFFALDMTNFKAHSNNVISNGNKIDLNALNGAALVKVDVTDRVMVTS